MYYYIINDKNLEIDFNQKWWLVRSDKLLLAKDNLLEVGIDGYTHLEYLYVVTKYKKNNYFWTFGQFRYGRIVKRFNNAAEAIEFLKYMENEKIDHGSFKGELVDLCNICIKAIADSI